MLARPWARVPTDLDLGILVEVLVLLEQSREDLVLLDRQMDGRTGRLAAGKPEGKGAKIDKTVLKAEVSRRPATDVADDAKLEA